MKYAAQDTYGTFGSLALAPEEPRLVVHEGLVSNNLSVSEDHTGTSASKAPASLVAVVSVVAVVVIALCALVSQVQVTATVESAFESADVSTIYVGSGDTVWGIAEDCDVEGASTQDVVNWIESENGLDDSGLSVGQAIEVPNFVG